MHQTGVGGDKERSLLQRLALQGRQLSHVHITHCNAIWCMHVNPLDSSQKISLLCLLLMYRLTLRPHVLSPYLQYTMLAEQMLWYWLSYFAREWMDWC